MTSWYPNGPRGTDVPSSGNSRVNDDQYVCGEPPALIDVSHARRYADFGPEEVEEFRWWRLEENGIDV